MLQATFTVPQGNLWFRFMLFIDLVQSMIRSEWHHNRQHYRRQSIIKILWRCCSNVRCCWYATNPCGIWGVFSHNDEYDGFDIVERRYAFARTECETALARSENGYFLFFGIINGNIPNHRQEYFPCPWAWKMYSKIRIDSMYPIGKVLTSHMCHSLYDGVDLRLYALRGEYRNNG